VAEELRAAQRKLHELESSASSRPATDGEIPRGPTGQSRTEHPYVCRHETSGEVRLAKTCREFYGREIKLAKGELAHRNARVVELEEALRAKEQGRQKMLIKSEACAQQLSKARQLIQQLEAGTGARARAGAGTKSGTGYKKTSTHKDQQHCRSSEDDCWAGWTFPRADSIFSPCKLSKFLWA